MSLAEHGLSTAAVSLAELLRGRHRPAPLTDPNNVNDDGMITVTANRVMVRGDWLASGVNNDGMITVTANRVMVRGDWLASGVNNDGMITVTANRVMVRGDWLASGVNDDGMITVTAKTDTAQHR